jgi:hypothetical protein
MTATGTVGFFGWAVGKSDRDGFISLKIKDNGLIGRFKEGSDPIFGGYGAFPAVFGFRLHDRATNVAARVCKHKGVRRDATPRTASGAGDLDFQAALRVGKVTVMAVVTVITVIGGQRGLTAKSACAAWLFRFTVITVTIFKTIRVRNGREILRSLVMVMESCRMRRVYCFR